MTDQIHHNQPETTTKPEAQQAPMRPEFSTERFDVFHVRCERNPDLGLARDVYLAFYRGEDVPRPVCVITVWFDSPLGNYVEWCWVDEEHRRRGIATEVLLAIQEHTGPLLGTGITESGRVLVAALGTVSWGSARPCLQTGRLRSSVRKA